MTSSAQDLVREVEGILSRRMEHLERENSKLKKLIALVSAGVGVALALCFGLLMVGFRGVGETVEASRFSLRDEAGLVRGMFELDEKGTPQIVLRDRDGRERAKLALIADGSPGLTLADREGRSRVVLGVLPDQTANLAFADAGGKTRSVLGLAPNGSSTLVFADRAGETRVGVGVDATGQPGITLYETDQPSPEAVPADSAAVPEAAPLP